LAFQRSIRFNGKQIRSPKFDKAADANNWYREKQREKLHLKEGIPMPLDDRTTVTQYFKSVWLPRRKTKYTQATWGPDEQRFEKYCEKVIGNFRVSRINPLQIKACLIQVTEKHGMSIATRDRVRALLSKFFGDSMNEEKPLRSDNPAFNITFSDPRQGKKKPRHIARQKDVIKFLNQAKTVSPLTFAITATFLMSALRKSELIALTWDCFDSDENQLIVKNRLVQSENRIHKGTKAGRQEMRDVPISDALVGILIDWRKKSAYQAEDDFIFPREDGNFISPRVVWSMIKDVRDLCGVDATPHALRHSFGRIFVANGGTVKSLQTMLGHASSSTTEIYSELAAEQIKKDRNIVSFDIEEGDDA
jgi:site-specific recombinase XerD